MVAITDLVLDQKNRMLTLSLDNGKTTELSCEFLRVYSPSAEVRGHGPGQEVLQIDKEDVNIVAIDPVGNYAVRLVYSDGHNTGIYAWDLLVEFAENKEEYWQDYLGRLEEAGHQRKV
jgi:DUF971 family protein